MCTVIHMDVELQERIRRTRRVAIPWDHDESRGVTGIHLDRLLERWANGYDWGVH